jgi:hypothetical protein
MVGQDGADGPLGPKGDKGDKGDPGVDGIITTKVANTYQGLLDLLREASS